MSTSDEQPRAARRGAFAGRVAWLPLVALAIAAAIPAKASAQSILNGYWGPLFDEDRIERIPGPDQGEYVGLPITAAARKDAQSWDPEVLTLPQLQCRPHPSLYGIRGVGVLRIWGDRDPQTLKQTAIHTWIQVWEAQRTIWMDDHPAPPPWAAHTWSGFSVGHWKSDVLHVHTIDFKRGWVRRNGLLTDDRATFDERFFVDGDILTHIMMISDPEYLSEPLVKSTEYERDINAPFPPYPCREVTEVAHNQGFIPHAFSQPDGRGKRLGGASRRPNQGSDGRRSHDVATISGQHEVLPQEPDAQLHREARERTGHAE